MKYLKIIITLAIITGSFTSCKENAINAKAFSEVLIDHPWRLENIECYDEDDKFLFYGWLYDENDTVECYKYNYKEFFADGTCKEDTIEGEWFITDANNELILNYVYYHYYADTIYGNETVKYNIFSYKDDEYKIKDESIFGVEEYCIRTFVTYNK